MVNALTVEVVPRPGPPPGFRTRYRQLGPLLGGEMLGATVYELDPGERSGPYHYELGNEECLLVLDRHADAASPGWTRSARGRGHGRVSRRPGRRPPADQRIDGGRRGC